MARSRAFTLVELLVVVLILGILGAIVLPRFSNATAAARASMLADDLRIMRTQINVYKAQHIGVPPGHPGGDIDASPTEAAVIAQMTLSSTAQGATAAAGTDGYPYGPYMREIPVNPVNGKSTIQLLGPDDPLPEAGDDSHGWIYQPSSVTLQADCSGADEAGKVYITY